MADLANKDVQLNTTPVTLGEVIDLLRVLRYNEKTGVLFRDERLRIAKALLSEETLQEAKRELLRLDESERETVTSKRTIRTRKKGKG